MSQKILFLVRFIELEDFYNKLLKTLNDEKIKLYKNDLYNKNFLNSNKLITKRRILKEYVNLNEIVNVLIEKAKDNNLKIFNILKDEKDLIDLNFAKLINNSSYRNKMPIVFLDDEEIK